MMSPDLSLPVYRRAYRRFRVEAPATLVLQGNRKEEVILQDVSARGGCIIGRYPLAVNEKLGIVIKISFLGAPLYRDAKVVWIRKTDDHVWTGGIDFGAADPIELL